MGFRLLDWNASSRHLGFRTLDLESEPISRIIQLPGLGNGALSHYSMPRNPAVPDPASTPGPHTHSSVARTLDSIKIVSSAPHVDESRPPAMRHLQLHRQIPERCTA